MGCIKAVIFDYVGTLVNCRGYSMDASKEKLFQMLTDEGFNCDRNRFMQEYSRAHEKYRKVRYGELREVTNAIWVAEALTNLGFDVNPTDARVKSALNVFFQDFIDTLTLREDAKKLLKRAQAQFKVGLITNFTYTPVIYKSLRKLGISEYFNATLVSEAVGWRKPSSQIFRDALEKLQVSADQAIYVGDSPTEDIKGASDMGMKTIFVPSQFNSVLDLNQSFQKPNYIASDLGFIIDRFAEITC